MFQIALLENLNTPSIWSGDVGVSEAILGDIQQRLQNICSH